MPKRNNWAEFTLKVAYEEGGEFKEDTINVACDHLRPPRNPETLHALVEEHREEIRKHVHTLYRVDGIFLVGWHAVKVELS